ncbi:MAG: hypothetical protein QM767_15185 [Anaeromyxobacter sp.]
MSAMGQAGGTPTLQQLLASVEAALAAGDAPAAAAAAAQLEGLCAAMSARGERPAPEPLRELLVAHARALAAADGLRAGLAGDLGRLSVTRRAISAYER